MKQKIIATSPDSRRLVMLFGGWAAGPSLFENLEAPEGYDVMLLWDYRDESLDTTAIERYDEIVVVAWSYGVAMAARALDRHTLPVTRRVAVNGTLHPVDDTRGIPSSTFDATLDNLSERSIQKFYRRMAGGQSGLEGLSLPGRPVDELAAELAAIGRAANAVPVSTWDLALVSDGDLIISPRAQANAWQTEACMTEQIDGPHMPPRFDLIVERAVVSKEKVARHFNRAVGTYDANAPVQLAVARRLAGLIGSRPLGDVVEAGCGTGLLTRLLPPCKSLTLWDLATQGIDPGREATIVTCDAETAITRLPAESLDAIVTASALQWFNSPRRFLDECRRVLRPGGMLAVATFGDRNFSELDSVAPGRRHFPSLEVLRAMIPDGLEVTDSLDELITMEFDNPLDILRHLRATGVNGFNNPHVAAADFAARYPRRDDGHVTMSYNPVYIKAVKKC